MLTQSAAHDLGRRHSRCRTYPEVPAHSHVWPCHRPHRPYHFGITTCPGRVSSGATRPPSLVCNLLFCRIVVVSGASHGCHEQASYTNQRGQTSASVHLANAATCYPSVWQCSEALGCATSPRTLWQATACGGTSVCSEGRQNTRGRVALRHSLRDVCASEI